MPHKWAKLGFLFCVSRRFTVTKGMSGFSTLFSSVKRPYIGTSSARASFPAFRWPERQTRTFLYVTLRYLFLFSQLLQLFANDHKSLQ